MVIARRFRGPPESANGGYACGVVARAVGGVSKEATLRRPPPLDRELVRETVDGRGLLRDGDTVIAEAEATTFALDVPAPVSFQDAERAALRYPSFTEHPFPMCFTCGPDRAPGDGLRIFPGAVDGRAIAAAPWVPDDSLDDGHGHVATEILWAALDCPSWFGLHAVTPWTGNTCLLGRLATTIYSHPEIGARCVAVGWAIARDGRKVTTGSALFEDDGNLVAVARATWVELR